MIDTNDPTNDLVRELYARFGLAYYHSEVLHRGLCIFLALSGFSRRELITRPRVEERLAHAFSLTFGEVINELAANIPEEFSARLVEAREKRNFLAHHFWFNRSHLMFRSDHIRQLIIELNGYSEIFHRLDEEISQLVEQRGIELGVNDEILQDCMVRLLLCEEEEPLPSIEVVRDREKKLKHKQCLIRVWEFELPQGGKPLIFEMKDGSFWQLCDVGLGWTRYENKESHWVENMVIKPYLPADIIPRPKCINPWDYEFTMKFGATFWVKPGKHPNTYKWGVRSKNRNTE